MLLTWAAHTLRACDEVERGEMWLECMPALALRTDGWVTKQTPAMKE